MTTEAQVTWVEDRRFVGEGSSGHAIVVDASAEKRGPSPMELLLIGMAGCTAYDVVSILEKKRQAVTGLKVSARAERAAGDAARLHRHRGRVSGPGPEHQPQGGGGRHPPVGGKVLLGLDHAGQDGAHHDELPDRGRRLRLRAWSTLSGRAHPRRTDDPIRRPEPGLPARDRLDPRRGPAAGRRGGAGRHAGPHRPPDGRDGAG